MENCMWDVWAPDWDPRGKGDRKGRAGPFGEAHRWPSKLAHRGDIYGRKAKGNLILYREVDASVEAEAVESEWLTDK